MKEKTSITLSGDVLTKIDRIAGSRQSRSAFIEGVLRKYLRERERGLEGTPATLRSSTAQQIV